MSGSALRLRSQRQAMEGAGQGMEIFIHVIEDLGIFKEKWEYKLQLKTKFFICTLVYFCVYSGL